ncbi:MAG: GntR family transcriptional regulator [Deltaproteobacteria bacterium]|nr:GntR family transcriptional regulator [Deltaproteobacteria bacterium]
MEKNTSLPQIEMKKKFGMEVASLADLVTTQIRELIITGEFKPGQQLKEDELCKLFAISRPPIREAFKTLEANGIVFRRPRRGVFVSEFTAKDVEEVYTIVAMLYQKATDMAMEVMTDRELDILASNIDMMVKFASTDPPNLRDYQAAHHAFHETIMELAGNERMKVMEQQLRYQISIFSYKSFQDRHHLLSSCNYHQKILEAIQDKNRKEALALVEEHILRATEFLTKKLSD